MFYGFSAFFSWKSNLLKTHFVVGTADIVGSQFKFVGLHDVMLYKGLNFIAARVFCSVFCPRWVMQEFKHGKTTQTTAPNLIEMYKQNVSNSLVCWLMS